ncbi:uncharacterized protein LOC111339012 [Stylophora pistillata]|uniref:uncharacterized protein LOC111339012 n=1 Tax=Stylophora pistillata TaxID=50429 RepID=UPI000C05052E|nr:uncharacterized protein LOC111339012 [Stylophora pistillata]
MQIQQQISSAPIGRFTPFVKSKASAADNDSDDSDNDGEQLRGTEVPCNGHHKGDRSNSSTMSQQFNGLNISENSAQSQPGCTQTGATGNEMSSEHLPVQSINQGEEEEGWEVVRRSKKR